MNNIIKYAKIYLAKGQIKKFRQYLLNDNPNNTIDQINQKINLINKSFQPIWFMYRFIQQKKHIQDIDVQLKNLIDYGNLNKQLKTFVFDKDKSFSDLRQFLNKFKSHQVKTNKFQAPSYCQKILSKGGYYFYYADAKDKQCYNDLHKCNMIDLNGNDDRNNQYAKWCVVTGSMPWGHYTQSQFPFYVYVTDSNNKPVMLFNFGYDWKAQIKNIHDDAFSNYDNWLIEGIKQLAKKYDFQISKNTDDYSVFNRYSQLYYKDINQFDISKSDKNKYGGLWLFDDVILDLNKMQKAYFIINKSVCKMNKYSYNNQHLIDLLMDQSDLNLLNNLVSQNKINSEKIFNKIIYHFIKYSYLMPLYSMIEMKQISQENVMIDVLQCFCNNKRYNDLYHFLRIQCLKFDQCVKYAIQCLQINQQFGFLVDLIKTSHLQKYPKLKHDIVKKLIDNKQQYYLLMLVKDCNHVDKDQNKQILQLFLDEKQYEGIYYLTLEIPDIDEPTMQKIVDTCLQNRQYSYVIQYISEHTLSKKIIEKVTQVFLKNKLSDGLFALLKNHCIDNIDTKNLLYQCLIDTESNHQLFYLYQKNLLPEQMKDTVIYLFIDKEETNKLYCIIKDFNDVNYAQFLQIIDVMQDTNSYQYLYNMIYFNLIQKQNLNDSQAVKIKDRCINILLNIQDLYWVENLLYADMLDEEQINQLIDRLFLLQSYNRLYLYVINSHIKNNNILSKIITKFKYLNQDDYLYRILSVQFVGYETVQNDILNYFIQKKDFSKLYSLVNFNLIKDSDKIKSIIKLLVDNKNKTEIYLIPLMQHHKIDKYIKDFPELEAYNK